MLYPTHLLSLIPNEDAVQDETGKPQSMRIAKIEDIGITCHRGESIVPKQKARTQSAGGSR